jgi:hypothetical protein
MSKNVGNGLNLQGQRIINVGDPSAVNDAANKQYVDNVARGLSWKQPARLSPTTNVSVASPGTSFDGKTAVNGDSIFLQVQTAGAENGLYTFNGGSSPLTRRLDADSGTELQPGTAVTVTEGTANADKVFILISDAAVTIGTTSTTWGQLGGGTAYTGSNGVNVSGSTITGVVVPSGGLLVGASGFSVDTAVITRKIAGNMGNGTLTVIPITHNLGTKDILVSVRLNSTDEEWIADWVATDANTVTFTFPTAPASGAYRYSIHG